MLDQNSRLVETLNRNRRKQENEYPAPSRFENQFINEEPEKEHSSELLNTLNSFRLIILLILKSIIFITLYVECGRGGRGCVYNVKIMSVSLFE